MTTKTHQDYVDEAKSKPNDVLLNILADINEAWKANEDWRDPDHSYGHKLYTEYRVIIRELFERSTKGEFNNDY